jgi:hypothetical protein
MNLCPLVATRRRCIGQSLETKRNGVPSAEEDLETIRFRVFAAPALHRAYTERGGRSQFQLRIRVQSRCASEIRSQRSEARRQRSEVRGQQFQIRNFAIVDCHGQSRMPRLDYAALKTEPAVDCGFLVLYMCTQ